METTKNGYMGHAMKLRIKRNKIISHHKPFNRNRFIIAI
jgi:hypothetical protein